MISREQVKKAMAAIKSAADAEFFFASLTSPEWIRPLMAEGLFSNPPAPIHENGLVAFPFWPQSGYLKRMAGSAADDVLAAILAIPATENIRIHEDLADAACDMPAPQAARIVPLAAEWAASPYQQRLPEKVGALVAHLAKGGEATAALDLARALLTVQPDPRHTARTESPYALPPEAQGRIHEWEYGEILKKHVPALIEATGEAGFNLLCDLLEEAVRISHPRSEGPDDYSYVWRTAIEEHPLNKEHRHGVRDHLVSAVRDAGVSVVSKTSGSLPNLLTALEARPWKVFHRLALDLLRRFAARNVPLVRARLLDVARAEDLGLFHEFWLLAKAGLPLLDPADREQFFANMDAKLREDEAAAGKEETPERQEEERRHARIWMYRRLSILADVLPPSRAEQFAALQGELGPFEHADLLAYSTGATWVGPTSPKSGDDLSAMSVAELVAFLREWPGEGRRDEPSPEGLGRTLAGVVAAAPEKYAAEAEAFEELDPTYVRALVSGLRDGHKAKRFFSWESVLRLCQWVLAQEREIPGRDESQFDEVDPSWSWTRRAIGDLLTAGFDSAEGDIPIALREAAWAILEPLTEDPDPTPTHEATYGGKNMDPTTLSINTVRGEAMHAVVHYGLWVRRHFERDAAQKARIDRGFEEMPEVRRVLDLHLDPDRDPSAAVRSVYGQWFAWLYLLDPTWATANVDRIFSPDGAFPELSSVAWEAYIIWGGTYDNMLTVLRDQYAHAIDRIGRGAVSARHPEQPDDRLAEHLMVYYWRGRLPLNQSGGLLARFYSAASADLRAHALGFVGRTVRNEEGPPIPDEVRLRLQGLIEWRIAQARQVPPEERTTELEEYGWWFASQKFPDDWSLARLLEILALARRVDDSSQVVEVLATMIDRHPEEVIDALTLMVEGNDDWGFAAWVPTLRPTLTSVLSGGHVQAREKTIDLIHLLGAKGLRDFEQLLSTSSE
jgi:hypothetical protein